MSRDEWGGGGVNVCERSTGYARDRLRDHGGDEGNECRG